MGDQMMQGIPFHMGLIWAVFAALFGFFVWAILYFGRRAPTDNLLIAELASGLNYQFNSPVMRQNDSEDSKKVPEHDTLFILPDISHYTRFMTGSRFAFGHAQHIILSLITAMIEAACKTVELSKLEGDAALFYVDADQHSADVVGQTVMEIFEAFYKERQRQIESNLCPCHACQHIRDLELKIFVHRGRAARFTFRNSVDHFGTDVIIIHRMMKNGVLGHRYVMVTDAASDSIKLSGNLKKTTVEEEVEHVGCVQASVFEIDDASVNTMSELDVSESISKMTELGRKLRRNIQSVKSVLQFKRNQVSG